MSAQQSPVDQIETTAAAELAESWAMSECAQVGGGSIEKDDVDNGFVVVRDAVRYHVIVTVRKVNR